MNLGEHHEMMAFLDTEFTDLMAPAMLSLGLVTLAAREHDVDFELSTTAGKARVRASSEFVRCDGALDFWGLVPDSACTEWEMGRRTGEWPVQLAADEYLREFGKRGGRGLHRRHALAPRASYLAVKNKALNQKSP